ncbi:MAG TPA: hypothetical protein VFG21_04010 [Xanthomonadaceae bacterium]|nr:hypothetical protein [Xanthomonadaceae bacterium]
MNLQLGQQIGSRHRLSLQLPEAVAHEPVFVQLLGGRHQPMRIQAMPLEADVAQDLARVCYTSMIISALLLLGLVSAIGDHGRAAARGDGAAALGARQPGDESHGAGAGAALARRRRGPGAGGIAAGLVLSARPGRWLQGAPP